jgi:hypothetical protein
VADRQRAFGDRLGSFLGGVRQASLVVLLGGGCRGIDVGGDQVLRRQIRLGTLPHLARGLRMVGRIVIHGPKLSAAGLHHQRSRRALPGKRRR